ncbi:MAG: 2-dehydro-3-deoxygluconokinase [Candidatus Azotimanducaceae bacterium]|jgi:2-dehydro-3-deoxygluconokinase
MTSILGIGECMVELSSAGTGLWRQGFSGDVFNALWYARALSDDNVTVAFHTALGTDPLSDQLLKFAQNAGIDCTNTPRFEDRKPGLYSIQLDGAERSFTYWRDTSAARMMMRSPELLWPKVEAAEIIYLSGITLAILPEEDCQMLLEGLQVHKKETASIVFDPNIRPHLWQDKDQMRSVISQAAALSDIVLPSFDDETSAFGDRDPETTARRYYGLGAEHVVVKNGPGNTIHLQNGFITSFSVAPVKGIIDTTAAGDSFNGAYIAALLAGVSTEDAIRTAQLCAEQVITHKGALIAYSDLSKGQLAISK